MRITSECFELMPLMLYKVWRCISKLKKKSQQNNKQHLAIVGPARKVNKVEWNVLECMFDINNNNLKLNCFDIGAVRYQC